MSSSCSLLLPSSSRTPRTWRTIHSAASSLSSSSLSASAKATHVSFSNISIPSSTSISSVRSSVRSPTSFLSLFCLFVCSVVLLSCSSISALEVYSPLDHVYFHLSSAWTNNSEIIANHAPIFTVANDDHLCRDRINTDERDQYQGAIIMARRGLCSFEQKARIASQYGAAVVVVGNNEPLDSMDDLPWRMIDHDGKTPLATVPLIFILKGDYEDILAYTTTSITSTIRATVSSIGLVYNGDGSDNSPYPPGLDKLSPTMKYLVIFAPFVLAIYSAVIFFWKVPGPWTRWIDRIRNRGRNSNNSNNNNNNNNNNNVNNNNVNNNIDNNNGVANGLNNPASNNAGSVSIPMAVIDSNNRRDPQDEHKENEIDNLSLPVPPSLSDNVTNTPSTNPSNQSTNSNLGSRSSNGNSRRRGDTISEEEREQRRGLITEEESEESLHLDEEDHITHANQAGESQSSNLAASSSVAASSPAVAGAAAAAAPSSSSSSSSNSRSRRRYADLDLRQQLYYYFLKTISCMGKPYYILLVHSIIYPIHMVVSLCVLISGWNEDCVMSNTYQSMASLWFARAVISWRICHWQTHSNTLLPNCFGELFFRNWVDCYFLLSGSMATLAAQREDCPDRSPVMFNFCRFWVLLTVFTFALRIIAFGLTRLFKETNNQSGPNIAAIFSRSFFVMLNGGFACAGPLDRYQPATSLDLLLIPTKTFRDGMYPSEDAMCAICCSEYNNNETLRILPCGHHYHKDCVDTWLLQKNSCPTCRQTIDESRDVHGDDGDEVRVPQNQRPPSPSQAMV